MTAAPPTLTVAEFIERRLDEDEAAARAMEAELAREFGTPSEAVLHSSLDLVGTGWMEYPAISIDSTRVLAQVEALRAVVGVHAEKAPGVCSVCSAHDYPCPTLRALASIWRGHEEWREEWA